MSLASRLDGYESLIARTHPDIVEEYQERVSKGAILMDKHMPAWADKINLADLDLSSEEYCVLGQCFAEEQTLPRWMIWEYNSLQDAVKGNKQYGAGYYGSSEYWDEPVCVANYEAGITVLTSEYGDLDDDQEGYSISHGFNDHDGRWGLLDALWVREIRQRQS